MAAPKFNPTRFKATEFRAKGAIGNVSSYQSPDVVPDSWSADRPGDLKGAQPRGAQLGNQGPDQGYAMVLARRIRAQLVLSDAEDADDAVAGCTAIGLRRASIFSRAPVIHDLRIAFTIWGFLDTAPPAELIALRLAGFERAADPHHYDVVRALADNVPESTLRLRPDDVYEAYPSQWRTLLGITD